VVVISAPVALHPELNYSAGEVRALAVHRGPPGATGRGVVVGIIDSGIEVRHGVFHDGELKTRILALWDQNASTSDGAPGPGGLGRVYSRRVIDDAVKAKRKLGTADPVAHGEDDQQSAAYFLHEEEVPRAGVQVEASFQRARWYDGAVVGWYGRRKTSGRGEGGSGLRFDVLEDSATPRVP
jgi:hypothetical protein